MSVISSAVSLTSSANSDPGEFGVTMFCSTTKMRWSTIFFFISNKKKQSRSKLQLQHQWAPLLDTLPRNSNQRHIVATYAGATSNWPMILIIISKFIGPKLYFGCRISLKGIDQMQKKNRMEKNGGKWIFFVLLQFSVLIGKHCPSTASWPHQMTSHRTWW